MQVPKWALETKAITSLWHEHKQKEGVNVKVRGKTRAATRGRHGPRVKHGLSSGGMMARSTRQMRTNRRSSCSKVLQDIVQMRPSSIVVYASNMDCPPARWP